MRPDEDFLQFGVESKFPDPLGPDAKIGLAGDFLNLVAAETEADPAALLFQFLVAFGNLVGKSPYFEVGATKHNCNLFLAIVGNTATARKGTSWALVKRFLDPVDPDWAKRCRMSGLGSGEALISAVSDLTEEQENLPVRPKEKDKRALVDEGELARILKVSQREGSTLSAVIRNAWDGGDLQNRVKDQMACLVSTQPHVSIIAHTTKEELLKLISSTDISNGSINRYLWVSSKRSKLVAMPKMPDETAMSTLIGHIKVSAGFAKTQGMVKFTAEAEAYWREIYPSLNKDKLGVQGAIAARAAPIVIRLALIYALLDHETAIDTPHLKAAQAAWKYCEASVGYLFGNSTGNKSADKLMDALDQEPNGLTRTEISVQVFARNVKSDWLDCTLGYLKAAGYIDCLHEPNGATRKTERWFSKQRVQTSSNSYFVHRNKIQSSDESSSNSYFVQANTEGHS